jgi:argininosuccinate lyase
MSQTSSDPQLWGGRFSGSMDAHMARFNASLPFDWRLWDADIAGSIAWAKAIAAAGLLSEQERDEIVAGLSDLRVEIAASPEAAFIGAGDEDIHTAYVERRLTERIGAIAGKLHTGRSRNDQVATDARLWLRGRSGAGDELRALILAAADRAEAEIDVVMPGYTHVQPAQPVRWSHWLLSHAWPWQRDLERLGDLARRVDVCRSARVRWPAAPSPSTALRLPWSWVSRCQPEQHGCRERPRLYCRVPCSGRRCWASTSAGLPRTWCCGAAGSSASSSWPTRYSTGSSLMPQKKNPDAMELLRGKSGRLVGSLTGVLTLLKGLPSAYDKDLQEDKEPLFDAVDTLRLALPVARGALCSLTIRPARMAASLGDELLATDLADALVRGGMPFRESHHLIGRVVRRAEELECALRDLGEDELAAIDARLAGTGAVWDFERSVEQRSTTGGTARASVRAQIEELRRRIG